MTRRTAGTAPPRIPFLLLLAGWLLLGLLAVGQSAMGRAVQGIDFSLGTIAARTLPAYVMLALLSPAVFAVVRRFPLERPGLLRRVAAHGVASVLFPAVHLPLSALGVWIITGGGTPILPTIQRWIFLFVAVDVFRYWALVWLYQALWWSRRAHARELELEHLRTEAARVQASLAEARLEAVTRRIKPHFLFNVLNVISGYVVKNEPERAATLIARLSDLLRRSLRQPDMATTLGEELAFVDTFLALESARLGDRLVIRKEIPPGLEQYEVPSFLLQPLVENATQHGIAPLAEGGTLTLRAALQNGRLLLEVADNGRGLPAEPRPAGIGLSSTRERLAMLYRDAATLEICSSGTNGTRVLVSLPARPRGGQSRQA